MPVYLVTGVEPEAGRRIVEYASDEPLERAHASATVTRSGRTK